MLFRSVIVGFPGETDEEFNETLNFLKDLQVSYLHVFTYSERENTLAAEMDQSVPMQVRKDRNRMLRILSVKKSRAFAESQVGIRHDVLFEQENKDGFMFGYTGNYVRIRHPYNPVLVNQVVQGIISTVNDDGTAALIIDSELPVSSNKNELMATGNRNALSPIQEGSHQL